MRALLAGLAIASAAVSAAPALSWWLTIDLQPTDISYRGVPASSLFVPLQRLSPLSCEANSHQFSAEQCQEIRGNKLQFRLSGDFNGDGKQELVEAVVAQLADGTSVNALIISSLLDPRTNQVFIQRGNGFSVVYREGRGLAWSPCMECGHATSIRWDPKRSTFVELEPEEYGAVPSNNSFKPKPLRGSA
jgi:hypothetical protein